MVTASSSIAHPCLGEAESQVPEFICDLAYTWKEVFLFSITSDRVEG